MRLVQKVLPVTDAYDGANLTTMINGKRHLTPMLAIGLTDILFALDSIPAIFGLTNAPYIVFATDAFALLALVELYFLIGGLLKRFVYSSMGLALVSAFIGVKLILEAMHGNELPFINGGAPIAWAPAIPTWLSLVIILTILGVTTVASLMRTAREPSRESLQR